MKNRNQEAGVGRGKQGGVKAVCLLKGMAVAYAVTCIFFIAYGILLTYSNVAESTIPTAALCCTAVSAGIAGYDWAKCIGKRGIVWGILAGMVYTILLYLITSFGSGDFAVHTSLWRMAAVAAAGGAIGGLLGGHRT